MKVTFYSITTPSTAAERKNIESFYEWLYSHNVSFNEINSVSLNENVMTQARMMGVDKIPALVAVINDTEVLIETDPKNLDTWAESVREAIAC